MNRNQETHQNPLPLFTGDHCLDKIGFIDHFIMDTLDKPAKKNKKVKQNRNEDFK
jgi:hypothetical protein